VGLGIAISVFYILRNNTRMPFYFQRSVYKNGEIIRLNLAQEVSFLNKASIKSVLDSLKRGSVVILDASETEYIDYDVLEIIKDFQMFKAPRKAIRISLIGFKHSYKVPDVEDTEWLNEHMAHMEPELVKRSAGKPKKLLRQLKTHASLDIQKINHDLT
jgi:MFS superfamily sulfate permease-like transporter